MKTADISLERLGVRILFGISLGLAVLFASELAVDLSRTHVPWHDLAATPRAGAALASTEIGRASCRERVYVLV